MLQQEKIIFQQQNCNFLNNVSFEFWAEKALLKQFKDLMVILCCATNCFATPVATVAQKRINLIGPRNKLSYRILLFIFDRPKIRSFEFSFIFRKF